MFPPGHVRTPFFLRGRVGEVEAYLGEDPNPEVMAYHDTNSAAVALYRIRFRQETLWPRYAGGPRDTVCADIFEHWLEVANHE
jgi:nitrile hydratase